MRPIISTEIADFLDVVRTNHSLLPGATGSPIHVLFPEQVAANIKSYEAVYRRHDLRPRIYYALKANKSPALLKSAQNSSAHVEVSSQFELSRALEAGFSDADILASGPVKNRAYLRLCAANGVLIAVDDPSELTALDELCDELDVSVAILIRINYPGSRFGVPLPAIHELLTAKKSIGPRITVKGFSFHIDSYSIEDRQKWLAEALDLVRLARTHQHNDCHIISIGGGFTVNYVADEAWRAWQKKYKGGRLKTYNSKTFSSVYPYHSAAAKEQFLDTVLSAADPGHPERSFADTLRANKLDLVIEAGRSLLDQAGLTIFAVTGVKHGVADLPMVIVDGNINSLSERWFGSDFLVSPMLIQSHGESDSAKAADYYIGGNLCLECDMLATAPVTFDHPPQANDKLVYINTAGYQMDSNESEFAQFPLATKFVAHKHNQTWSLTPDENA